MSLNTFSFQFCVRVLHRNRASGLDRYRDRDRDKEIETEKRDRERDRDRVRSGDLL